MLLNRKKFFPPFRGAKSFLTAKRVNYRKLCCKQVNFTIDIKQIKSRVEDFCLIFILKTEV